jgi:hypothetical protein
MFEVADPPPLADPPPMVESAESYANPTADPPPEVTTPLAYPTYKSLYKRVAKGEVIILAVGVDGPTGAIRCDEAKRFGVKDGVWKCYVSKKDGEPSIKEYVPDTPAKPEPPTVPKAEEVRPAETVYTQIPVWTVPAVTFQQSNVPIGSPYRITGNGL